jgi:hypothetical protein
MTPVKKSVGSGWKKRIRQGGLFIAVAAMLSPAAGCGGGDEWEEVSVQEPTKGIVTTLEEQSNGEYSVVEEQVVGTRDSSRVIVRKLDGTQQELTLDQARTLVNPSDTTSNHTVYHHHHSSGMGRAIWWGAMGYMMGRNLSTPVQPYVYRDNNVSNNGFTSRGYARGASISDELTRSSVTRTQMRPARARTGFFGRGGRSSSGG